MRKKLFISHSSKTEQNCLLLQAVCDGLGETGAGFDVLVDKHGIPAGDDWDRRLNEWMYECHAAVILFSNAALQSDWVKKEAAILSWRRELESDFKLIPVLLDSLAAEDLTSGLMGVLRISESQCIRNAADHAQICAAVAAGLGGTETAHKTPFDRLGDIVTRILKRINDPDVLTDAWQALGGAHKPQWHPNQTESYARALTRYLLRDSQHAFEYLQQTLHQIRPRLGLDDALELLEYIRPLWVDAGAAGGICKATQQGHHVALNGDDDLAMRNFTAECYLRRAWPLDDDRYLVKINNDDLNEESIVEQLRARFNKRGRITKTAVVDRLILKHPVVLLYPANAGQLPDEDLMDALKKRYPTLLFLVHTGPHLPGWLTDATLNRVHSLQPALDPDQEFEQYTEYENVKYFIEEQSPGNHT